MSKRVSLRNRNAGRRFQYIVTTTPAKSVAALLCLVLLFFSIALVILPTAAAQASNMAPQTTPTATSPVGGTPSPTITVTPSPTATSTPSPTPTSSPTPTETPKPTRTPKPSPTPSATSTPTATATATASPTPIPNGTAQPTATLQPTATSNPNATQTPASVPATQSSSSSSGGGTGLPPSTPTPPTTQGGGGAGSFLLPVIIGLVATLAIASVCVLSFFFLRERVLPAPFKTNLPPSGARPWSRFRQGSIHGGTNLYNQQTFADGAAPLVGAASWAIRVDDPGAGAPVPFTKAQSMHGLQSGFGMSAMPANAQPASNSFMAQGFSPAQPQAPFAAFPMQGPTTPQSQPYAGMPNSGFPQPQPYAQQRNSSFPQPQSYPQMPNAGFPPSQPNGQIPRNPGFPPATQGPQVPQQAFPSQQAFPPQQDFPPVQPGSGFYPPNRGSDIALDLDTPGSSFPDTGNIIYRDPSP